MIPHITFYTDRLPGGVGGCANGPVIRIRPQYRHDEGIHRHEIEHVRQWWLVGIPVAIVAAAVLGPAFALLGVAGHPLLYQFVRRYRLWAEVRAYRIQMRFPNASGVPISLESAARRLASPRYRLGLDFYAARIALQG